MQLTKQQIDRMVMRDGRVLVKIDRLTSDSVSFAESKIYVTPVSEMAVADMSARSGVVVSAPKNADIPHLNYSFKSDVEIQKGDRVWWSRMAIGKLLREKDTNTVVYTCGEDKYYLVHYPELVMRERGGEFVGLNDRVIGRVVYPEVKSTLDLSYTDMAKPLPDTYEVVYTPSGSGNYIDRKQKNTVIKGQRVVVANGGKFVSNVEDEYNKTLPEMLYAFWSGGITAFL